jgi:hypothetical protein
MCRVEKSNRKYRRQLRCTGENENTYHGLHQRPRRGKKKDEARQIFEEVTGRNFLKVIKKKDTVL